MSEIITTVQGQPFPALYSSEPIPFRDGSNPSGAAGARAVASFTLNTNPGAIYGIRINNIYQIPDAPSAEVVALFDYLSRVTDLQQTVDVTVAQQKMTLNAPVLQTHISGTSFLFYEFPEPFGPIQGSNNFRVELRRLTSYPSYFDGEVQQNIFPQAIVTLTGRLDVAAGPAPASRRFS